MSTLLSTAPEAITLYCHEGSSDKVGSRAIEPAGDGLFAVTFAYGRRGTTLNIGTKTSHPVTYDEARRIYDKLVREKVAKGYTPGVNGTPYTGGNSDRTPSGYLPQLLNPVDEAELPDLLRDDIHVAQEKFDGRRLLLRKEGATIDGINRRGLVVGLPQPLIQAFTQMPGDCVLDGESVGERFHAFDILNLDGQDIRSWIYRDRLTALINLVASVQQRAIRFTETAYTVNQKFRLHATLRSKDREGIVFKRLHAPYSPGRPNSGGAQLKHKFYATLSAVVTAINTRRSVEIRLFGPEGWQPAGNVTIPPNRSIPSVGQVVEVRYLYGFRQSGVLYQPVYLGPRSDVAQTDCVVSQLKYQAIDEERVPA
jgi:bifunctional non-homologous end joining protein LigD